MIDLCQQSGLPLAVDDSQPNLPLFLDGRLSPGDLEERRLEDLRAALADPNADGPDPAYFMYRGLGRIAARDGRGRYDWRYDVTVFPAGRVGDEYLRTLGHYHPPAGAGEVSYPEVYEVLEGSALFILQKVSDCQGRPDAIRVEDIILLRAEVGQKAMMLPDYGHWTVNVTDRPLVVSNWICGAFSSHYTPAIEARGPAVYVVAGSDGPSLRPNQAYMHTSGTVRHGRPQDAPELGLVGGQPIFHALAANPGRWGYLCHPADAAVDLSSAIEITGADPFPT